MGATVRISAKAARAILDELSHVDRGIARDLDSAKDQLSAALQGISRRAQRHRPAKRAAREKKSAKRATWVEVREAVFARAAGKCENPSCGLVGHRELHPDHMFGKARAESVETVWAICWLCHDEKTQNRPDGPTWWRRFIAHLDGLAHVSEGYGAAARKAAGRLAMVETRSGFSSGAHSRDGGARNV